MHPDPIHSSYDEVYPSPYQINHQQRKRKGKHERAPQKENEDCIKLDRREKGRQLREKEKKRRRNQETVADMCMTSEREFALLHMFSMINLFMH